MNDLAIVFDEFHMMSAGTRSGEDYKYLSKILIEMTSSKHKSDQHGLSRVILLSLKVPNYVCCVTLSTIIPSVR